MEELKEILKDIVIIITINAGILMANNFLLDIRETWANCIALLLIAINTVTCVYLGFIKRKKGGRK